MLYLPACKADFMSTINNIPFDINRSPVEKNIPVKRGGTVPVQHSEAIHPTEKQVRITERRKAKNRRRQRKIIKLDKRILGERRQMPRLRDSTEALLENAHISGRLIDLEV